VTRPVSAIRDQDLAAEHPATRPREPSAELAAEHEFTAGVMFPTIATTTRQSASSRSPRGEHAPGLETAAILRSFHELASKTG